MSVVHTYSAKVACFGDALDTGSFSLIRKRTLSSQLVSFTTVSDLGRSSIYNRLKFRGREIFHSVGFTQGSGKFHFANRPYAVLHDYAVRHCDPTPSVNSGGLAFGTGEKL